MAREFLPLWRHPTVAAFYVLSIAMTAWFMAGVWAFIWGMFMTDQEIGVSDSLTFLLGLVVELPSGVIADMLGRKRTIIIGCVCMVVGQIMIAFSGSFWGITIWYGLWTIGYAFQSGATEALVYDYLKSKNLEDQWERVRTTANIITTINYPICVAIGGILFGIWYGLPYIAGATVGVLGLIAVFCMHDSRTYKKAAFSFAQYGAHLRDGMGVLFRKAIVPVSIAAIVVLSMQIVFAWGLLRPYIIEGFGYTGGGVAQVIAVIAGLTALSVFFFARLRKRFGTVPLLFFCAFTYVTVFTALALPFNWFVGAVAVLITALSVNYVEQLFSVFINRHTHEEHRATTLSAVSLLTRAPYVLLAVVTGALAERNQLASLCLVLGLIGFAAVGWAFLLRRAQPADVRAT